MTGPAFSTRFKVRYAEIDGQQVVFNSRYLEYVEVAEAEFWLWTGIANELGAVWTEAEFHARRSEIDYLKPFRWGDEVEAWVRFERVGISSLTKTIELRHSMTGDLHAKVLKTDVHVHLPTGRSAPIPPAIRDIFARLSAQAYSAA